MIKPNITNTVYTAYNIRCPPADREKTPSEQKCVCVIRCQREPALPLLKISRDDRQQKHTGR